MLPPHRVVFIFIPSSVAQPWLSSNIREEADHAHAEMVHGELLRSSEQFPAIARSPSRCPKVEGLASIFVNASSWQHDGVDAKEASPRPDLEN